MHQVHVYMMAAAGPAHNRGTAGIKIKIKKKPGVFGNKEPTRFFSTRSVFSRAVSSRRAAVWTLPTFKKMADARPPRTDADGTVYEWDAARRAYFPKVPRR